MIRPVAGAGEHSPRLPTPGWASTRLGDSHLEGDRVREAGSPDQVHAERPTELEAWCRARLAPFKVPRAWRLVERLPRSEGGKLLRRALT